jgi:hypothetical protein
MVGAMQRAFEALGKLPEAQQEYIAERWLAELADEDAFDAKIDATAHLLAGLAEEALAEHRAGRS